MPVAPATEPVIDYTTHPADLPNVTASIEGKDVDIKALRKAIPPHCFKPKYTLSLYYLGRDLTLAVAGLYVAYNYIPLVTNSWARSLSWALWGFYEGLTWTGLWVLGHECGHSAFSTSRLLNNTVGFILHSALLTPYFAWRSTHRRHHIYANNLSKDHNYVPFQQKQYLRSLGLSIDTARVEDLTEDAPLINFLRLVLQQLIGFPWYLLTNITAAEESLPDEKRKSTSIFANSHFIPGGPLFRKQEYWQMFASNVGVLAMAGTLFYLSAVYGSSIVCLMYLMPYMWVNHWIVAITYLHHTHPSLPKYEDESWSFIRGATATIDREFGFIGRFFLHNIIEYHVVHHIFSRVPFYYGQEATEAIKPLLGAAYHEDRKSLFITGLWESFVKCQWIEPDKPDAEPRNRAMYYKSGPLPPIETSMGVKGFSHRLRGQAKGAGKIVLVRAFNE